MTAFRRRSALLAMTALVVAHADAALAAPVAPSARPLGGAYVSVSSCGDLRGVDITWTSAANVITSVSVSAIPAACSGAILALTLVDSAKTALATAGPVTITDATQPVNVVPSGSTNATSVTGAYLSMVGP